MNWLAMRAVHKALYNTAKQAYPLVHKVCSFVVRDNYFEGIQDVDDLYWLLIRSVHVLVAMYWILIKIRYYS